jgi:alpha-beta hydrolase superfamily lysophospholipase
MASDPTYDVLGQPYTVEVLDLGEDSEGPVVATLVHRPADVPTDRAVLHVHGFADYFFHTEYAEWWTDRGYDFYALDLRKYGRSILDHQTPNYVEDIGEYFPDLDAAWDRIVATHSRVVATAHSTGGLTLPLWLQHRRPEELTGVFLNSPWFDLQGSAWLRTPAARLALDRMGARQPRRLIPRKVSGVYTQSLHVGHHGEFDFNLEWKPVESFAVYAGWLRAIRRGHAELHRGLDVPAPCLVLSSARSAWPTTMGDDVHRNDVVLDVEQIRRWASSLGRHVTSIAVDGARHDVVLSLPEVRAQVYDEIGRWLEAYVPDR